MKVLALALALLALTPPVAGCRKAKPGPVLERLYCEGGVDYQGRGKTSECIVFELSGSTTGVIGTARLARRYQDRFDILASSPSTPSKFTLQKDGKPAGTVERSGTWVSVTLDDEPNSNKKSMRSDPPGVME